MSYKVKIAVLQLRCTGDKEKNFDSCSKLIKIANTTGVKMIFLPENFDFISENKSQTFDNSEPLDGNLINRYRAIARDSKTYLSLGGFHRKDASIPGKIFNSHVVIDDAGVIRAVYDKLHLFDVDIPNVARNLESSVVEPGRAIVPPVETPLGLVGLAICYDLRFPELSQSLREMSADVLTFPAAFFAKTGAAHWHILLRARAIENQCFVIAAAQQGQHNPNRCSYGHSLVLDPWGNIVGERTENGEGVLLCDIDTSLIKKLRLEMPVFANRRLDLFPSNSLQGLQLDIGEKPFKFGSHVIECSTVFYRSALSFAFVNISPLVPGHVLVSPIREASRFSDLSSVEVTDIYAVVRSIAPRLAAHFDAHSLTISQQDGPDAGQTVSHVHVHVLPRKPDDFAENDDIYKELQSHDAASNVNRKYRSLEDRNTEATEFRKLFY